jgi:transcriptional regulator with XRE-family HTH domain
MKTYAEALVSDRLERKIPQVQLCKELNVAQQTLSKWERGETEPRDYRMAKIAEYFGQGSNTEQFFVNRFPTKDGSLHEVTELSNALLLDRGRLGISQCELADKLGVVSQSVSKWELGLSVPRQVVLEKLADFFGADSETYRVVQKLRPKPKTRQGKTSPDNNLLNLAVRVGALTFVATKALEVLENPRAGKSDADRVADLLRDVLRS